MGAAFLDDVGLLNGSARILDVGAGTATLLYWLAARAAKVVAVDLYGQGPFRHGEADEGMLASAAAFAPGPYPEDRLEVRWMDARALDFEDGHFDAVVSFSSIEHFGHRGDVRAAAREIGRVLRPGGWAFLVTEGFVKMGLSARAPVQFLARVATAGRRCRTATPRSRASEVLTRREASVDIISASGLELVQPFDERISPAMLANPHLLTPAGTFEPVDGTSFPHLVLGFHGSRFTSMALPLRKAGGSSATTTGSTGRPSP